MRVWRILLVFASVQLFLGNLGLLGRPLGAFGAAVALLVFAALSAPESRYSFRAANLLPAASLIAALAAIARGSAELVFVYPLFLAALAVLPPRADHEPGERETLLCALFIYSFIVILEMHVPVVWHALHGWGLSFSKLCGMAIGQRYLLGPTASGIPIMLLFISYFVAAAAFAKRGGLAFLAKGILLLVVVQAALLMLLTPLAMLIQWKFRGWQLAIMHPEALFLFAFCISLRLRRPESLPGGRGPIRTAVAAAALAAALAFGVALRPSPGTAGGTVLVYNKGYLNLRVPEYGLYGYRSGGMFGCLPGFVESLGFRVSVVDTITAERLKEADALVVINVLEYFSGAEKDAIDRWVRAGGGLLALGDHTGVEGIRGPFNDLLGAYGVSFNFDSGTFILEGWRAEGIALPHPVTHGLAAPDEMEIWVGATLDIRPPALPVFVGRYGYSDWGNFEAFDKAYLGNRIFDPGEQLGDIVLVASAEPGKGKILVFGDTSTFQNLALVTGWRTVSRVFSWLTAGGGHGWWRYLCIAALLGIAVAAKALRSTLLIGLVSLGVAAGTAAGLFPRAMPREIASSLPTAMIDNAHFPRFDHATWFDNCIGGLEYNIMRAGFFPFVTGSFRERTLMASRLLVEIAPAKEWSSRELAMLDRFMEKGGWILYACGTEEARGSRRFLDGMGLELLDVPLASFVDTLGGPIVQVQEGWGVRVSNPNASVMAERYGYPYMVRAPRGAGGLVFIADSAFLLNRNLEGMEKYYEGNIEFLRHLFAGFRGVKP